MKRRPSRAPARRPLLDALESRLLLSAAPRIMEYLDRGVVATRSSSSAVFVSWRSLATDSPSLAFNVYRSTNGGAPVKRNSTPLTAGTNFSDSAASGSTYTYTIKSVLNNVESPTDGAYTLAANAAIGPLQAQIPLRNLGNYSITHISVADLDGDGRYDYIVDRIPPSTNEVSTQPNYIEAYTSDGTFLWAISAGPNSFDQDNIEPGSTTIDVGNWDGVTAYDMDGDGYAEVLYRSANGVVFGDGKTLSYPQSNNAQFISVIDGRTGAEKARIQVPTDFIFDGPMAASFGIGYLDGVHPSLVAKMKNRVGSGSFNQMFVAFDYNGTTITQKWKYITPPVDSDNGHNIRILDVDGDGKDEIFDTAQCINGDGTLRYNLRNANPSMGHGDRFFIGDLDPDRPGLEGYAVQQNNPAFVTEFYWDATTGQLLHVHYTTALTDDGRGQTGDIDPNHRGYEYWSFYGIYNSTTPTPGADPVETKIADEPNRPWPNFRIWWDGDVGSENLNNTTIDKWNPSTQGNDRLTTIYHYGSPTAAPREAPIFYGDIFGDWREEVIFENSDHLFLDVYTTQYASSTRLYSLSQDPEYRNGMTIKGYSQSLMLDYYLGYGMDTPPTPNIQVLPKASGPAVATPAYAALPTATSINLFTLGTDDAGEANLTYTWSAAGPANVAFSSNGANASKSTTATFFAPGIYIFTVTLTDSAGHTALSNITVSIAQTFSRLTLSPTNPSVPTNITRQFLASAYDQFGALMPTPALSWSLTAGTGSIDNGLYTAPASTGYATIQASAGAIAASTTITIAGPALPAPASFAATPTSASTINLTWSDIAGETGYLLESSTDNLTFSPLATAAANATSFTATGLTPDTLYYFRVRGANADGAGTPSATASANTFLLPFAWYRLDENTGTTLYDSTGDNPTGLTAGATWTTGRSGSALSLASSAYAQLPNDNLTTAAGAVSFWIKTATNFGSDAMIFYFSSDPDIYGNGGGSQNELQVNFTSSEKIKFFIEGTTTSVSITSASSYNNNAWHHIVATWDLNANAALYIDGTLVGSVTDDSNLFTNSQRTYLGRPNLSTNYYSGAIDDLRLFSSPIAAAQVSALYAATPATNTAPTIVSPAAAASTTFSTPNIALSALANDDSGEPNLTYTWSLLSGPAPINFGINNTNAAKNSSATFSTPGTYTLKLTITDPNAASTSSTTTVTFSPLSGDANFDNNVDLADYDLWYKNVGSSTPAFSTGDFNLDSHIDLADYDLWYAHVGTTSSLISQPQTESATFSSTAPASSPAPAVSDAACSAPTPTRMSELPGTSTETEGQALASSFISSTLAPLPTPAPATTLQCPVLTAPIRTPLTPTVVPASADPMFPILGKLRRAPRAFLESLYSSRL